MTPFDTIVHPREITTGQFVDKTQTAPELKLSADGMNKLQREQRHAALIDSGFIPAVSGSAEKSGTTTARVNTWWDSHFVRAEYRPDSKGFPQMPDDFTPALTAGRAISGGRHTHRMSYAGDDVTVRMPSAAAIKRYSAESRGTFDVPVTATFPGGDISGWVRVTQNGPATWSTQGLSFPDGDAAQVAEAVGAVLEARRPSTALRDAGDLLVRRADRIAAAGSKIQTSPANSFVTGAGYDAKHGVLAVKIGKRTYGYRATADRVRAFSNARSIGQAYNRLVKGRGATEVVECEKCNRFNVVGTMHRCPSKHKAALDFVIAATVLARKAAIAASK